MTGATLADVGVSSLTLQATVDGVTATKVFTVTISDPCKRAVLQPETPSPLSAMTVIRNFDLTKTQTFSVTTNLQTLYGISCNIACTKSGGPAYVTLAGMTITVNVSATTSANAGTQTVTLNCDSADFASSVVEKNYSF